MPSLTPPSTVPLPGLGSNIYYGSANGSRKPKYTYIFYNAPTGQPTTRPSTQPTVQPAMVPTGQPSDVPSSQPSRQPTRQVLGAYQWEGITLRDTFVGNPLECHSLPTHS